MYECSSGEVFNVKRNLIVTVGGCGLRFKSQRAFQQHLKDCAGPGYSVRKRKENEEPVRN